MFIGIGIMPLWIS